MALPLVDAGHLATVDPVDPFAVPNSLSAVRDAAEARLGADEAVIHAPVADAVAVQAIAASVRADGTLVVKLDDYTTWQFDAQSVAAGSATVLVPAAGTGRWLRMEPLLAEVVAAKATADNAVPKASVQQAMSVMVAGSVTFATLTLTAGSVVYPTKEIESAASGLLTVGAITPGAPGSVTITSANGAETSTIRLLVIG